MIYEVIDCQTVSIGNSDAENTIMAVKVQYLDENFDHTKVFELDPLLTDEQIKTKIEDYGLSIKNDVQKTRKVVLEGSL